MRDPRTGEVRIDGSLDEVPVELRAPIEAARDAALEGGVPATITVTDASGATRRYASVEEIPDDLRRIYERAREQQRP